MDEQIYSIPALQNEVQNLKERVVILEDEAKQDRKEFTQVTKAIGESLTRLTAIQEQQSKQIEDVNENIDSLREEMIKNNENNVKWYQDKYDLVVKILIVLVLIGWGFKGVSEVIKLINL